MKRRSRHKDSFRVYVALLISLILHLLFFIVYQDWAVEEVEKVLHPLRFREQPIVPERFRPVRPGPFPPVAMEPLIETEALPETPLDRYIDAPEPPNVISLVTEKPGLEKKKEGRWPSRPDTLPSLEEVLLEKGRLRAEELEEYAHLWLPDADTTDVESRRRRWAQQVVREAIKAMGGVDALTGIRHMRYQGRFHKSYGLRSQYAQSLPGGARLVYDGERGWVDIFGQGYPLQGEGLRAVEQRAKRWDFLSRYLGDGIQLSYVGLQRDRQGRLQHELRVEDLKFGGASLRAYFDAETHLLTAEETPAERPSQRVSYLDYGLVGRAFIWRKVETQAFSVWQYATQTYPVSYAEIGDRVFRVSTPETGWEGLETHEVEAILWIDVQITAESFPAMGVLAGATRRLNGLQREMVRKQIEEIAVADFRRRGLFPRVEVKQQTWADRSMPEGDFILELILYASEIKRANLFLYQAQLLEAGSRQKIMQDGPPNAQYYIEHRPGPISPGCLPYNLSRFSVDNAVAYVNRSNILERLIRTFDKVFQTVKMYQGGERDHFPYMHECCYCEKP